MKKNEIQNVQVFDFDWTMRYLGITNKKIIAMYKELNEEQLMSHYEGKKTTKDFPFQIHANKKFKGSAAGHYLPLDNIVEIKETIDEDQPTFWQRLLIAHEFAHALIGSKKIIGQRAGHGVLYYICLMRDVVWYAENISVKEKFLSLLYEFAYSCSLAQYRGINRICRSQSTAISLELNYFSINNLYQDSRSDINNLGEWFWDVVRAHIDVSENSDQLLDLPLSELINKVSQTLTGDEIVINDEQRLKFFRR